MCPSLLNKEQEKTGEPDFSFSKGRSVEKALMPEGIEQGG